MVGQLEVDASNACIPPSSPLCALFPPLPTTVRGESCILDGLPGRCNNDRPLIAYGSGRLVVVRDLSSSDVIALTDSNTTSASSDCFASASSLTNDVINGGGGTMRAFQNTPTIAAFVYRGHYHSACVTCVKFSPSGCYVASGDANGNVKVWTYDNEEEHLCKLDLSRCFHGPVRDISWDGESRRLCIVGESAGGASPTSASSIQLCKVIQWDTGVSCGELGQHSRGRVSTCAFRKCRPYRIMTGGEDGQVILNGSTPFRRLWSDVSAHDRAVNCVRYSPSNEWIVSVGGDRVIRVYDGKEGVSKCHIKNAHQASIYACAWSSDSTRIITSSADGTVKLWKLTASGTDLTCEHVWSIADDQSKGVCDGVLRSSPLNVSEKDLSAPSTCFSPESKTSASIGAIQLGCAFTHGDKPVSVGYNGVLSLLAMPASFSKENATSRSRTLTLSGHQGNLACMALHSASRKLYTGDTDGIVVAWNVENGTSTRLQSVAEDINSTDSLNKVHRGAIASVAVAHDGKKVLSVGWDDCLRTARSAGGDDTLVYCEKRNLSSQPNAMAIGTDVGLVITIATLAVFMDDHICSETAVMYSPLSVCVSKKDDVSCVGGHDGSIHIYSITKCSMNLEEVHLIESGHMGAVSALALSPDESFLASADTRAVCLWNSSDWTEAVSRNRWCFHTQRITGLAWSSDGSILASGSMDDTIFLWSPSHPTTRVEYKFAHRGGIVGLAFVMDDILLSVGKDGCVCQWNVRNDLAIKFN